VRRFKLWIRISNGQVWRTSLGIDHKFENNYIATLDMSYNKDINGVHVQNGD
jgi:hypothetical protein